jgi:hypothetical protein
MVRLRAPSPIANDPSLAASLCRHGLMWARRVFWLALAGLGMGRVAASSAARAGWAEVLGLMGLPPEAGERYLIVPALHSGLARRLQLIGSALQAAEDSGRTLLVAWHRSDHLDTEFEDLFDAASAAAAGLRLYRGNLAFLGTLLPVYTMTPPPPSSPMWLNRTYGLVPVVTVDSCTLGARVLEAHAAAPVVVLDPVSGIFFKQDAVPCQAFYARLSAFLQVVSIAATDAPPSDIQTPCIHSREG